MWGGGALSGQDELSLCHAKAVPVTAHAGPARLTFNALLGLGLVVITRALSPGRNHQKIVARKTQKW